MSKLEKLPAKAWRKHCTSEGDGAYLTFALLPSYIIDIYVAQLGKSSYEYLLEVSEPEDRDDTRKLRLPGKFCINLTGRRVCDLYYHVLGLNGEFLLD